MSKEKQDLVPEPMVFVGEGKGQGGKRVYRWAPLQDGKVRPGEPFYAFGKQIQKGASPGSMYRIPTRDGGSSVSVNAGEFIGIYPDQDQVAEWQIQHRAQVRTREAESKAAKARRERLDLERLEPIRRAYWEASYQARPHVLAEVIRFITSPGSLS